MSNSLRSKRPLSVSIAAVLVASTAMTLPLAAKAGGTVEYVYGGMIPGTSVARAFCPEGTIVTGGGGFTVKSRGAALQQSFPISDKTGVSAWGSTAIGWQVAANDWSDVQAYVVCLTL